MDTVFHAILERFAKNIQDFFFVQIGANDGVTQDPIFPFVVKHGWTGILVEPQENVFAKLVANYSRHGMKAGFVFEKVAIAEARGKVLLHSRAGSEFGLGASLMPDEYFMNVKPQAWKNRAARGEAVQVEVDAMTLDDLLQKHDVKKVDMFQIDVEGYDDNIIRMIDFERYTPFLVNYESDKLGQKKQECEELLQRHGYALHHHGLDTLAYLNAAGG